MEKTYKNFYLRKLRKAMGLRHQKDLAVRLGVSEAAVRQWEAGRRTIPQNIFILLGHILLWMYEDWDDPYVVEWRQYLGSMAQRPWHGEELKPVR